MKQNLLSTVKRTYKAKVRITKWRCFTLYIPQMGYYKAESEFIVIYKYLTQYMWNISASVQSISKVKQDNTRFNNI